LPIRYLRFDSTCSCIWRLLSTCNSSDRIIGRSIGDPSRHLFPDKRSSQKLSEETVSKSLCPPARAPSYPPILPFSAIIARLSGFLGARIGHPSYFDDPLKILFRIINSTSSPSTNTIQSFSHPSSIETMAPHANGNGSANGNRTVPVTNGRASWAEKHKVADHFIGGNRLENAPPSQVKDFVAAHDGHTVITNVSHCRKNEGCMQYEPRLTSVFPHRYLLRTTVSPPSRRFAQSGNGPTRRSATKEPFSLPSWPPLKIWPPTQTTSEWQITT
jgi:hypothetical protein